MKFCIFLGIVYCALSACQEPIEQGELAPYQQYGVALEVGAATLDVASDMGEVSSGQEPTDEVAALAAQITYGVSGYPEGNVPTKQMRPDAARHCSTDLTEADATTDAAARGAGAPEPVATRVYRPVVWIAPEEAPRKPSNLRGGHALTLTPSQEMVSLYAAFQAEGCDQPARASARACTQHPYNEAIRREVEDPMAALEAARAEYAAARGRLQEEAVNDAP
jgi:hypothetical protein